MQPGWYWCKAFCLPEWVPLYFDGVRWRFTSRRDLSLIIPDPQTIGPAIQLPSEDGP